MKTLYIRKARPADIEDLTSLLRQLFSIEEDFSFDAVRQRRGLEMLCDRNDTVIFIAEKANLIIGMCTGQLLLSTSEGGFSLLVEDVVVDISWRGQGVGTQLLKALEEWGGKKRVSRFQLLADRSNEAGLGFYKKHKWQTTQLICLQKKSSTT
jgi:ribosomal protein S18 acetylase RimI-like enzyme